MQVSNRQIIRSGFPTEDQTLVDETGRLGLGRSEGWIWASQCTDRNRKLKAVDFIRSANDCASKQNLMAT